MPNVFETETLKATVVMTGRFYLRKIIWIRNPSELGVSYPALYGKVNEGEIGKMMAHHRMLGGHFLCTNRRHGKCIDALAL